MSTYGPANDTPETELEIKLAKLVQNAKANNLEWCAGSRYRNSKLETVSSGDSDIKYCCALGAKLLSNDTAGYDINFSPNDSGHIYNYNEYDLLSLGFRLAMTDIDD